LYHFSSSLLSQAVLSDVRRYFRCQSKTEVQLSRVRAPLPSNRAHLADTVEPGCLQIKTKGTQGGLATSRAEPSCSPGTRASSPPLYLSEASLLVRLTMIIHVA